LNRLTNLAQSKNSSPVGSYNYTLGLTGNRASATEPNGRALNWSYDGIYRLTNETISLDPHPTPKNGSVDYGLDPVGNRLSQNSTLPGIPSAGPLTYDFNDRLSTESYDPNGNTTVSGARYFAYDFENRLKSMSMLVNGTMTVIATVQYDGDGNRVAKTVGGGTTRYLVDDLNPTGYAQVVEELGASGVQRTYTYGTQRINQNQLGSSTWTPSFYGYDGGGSVRTLTDATGTVTDTYDYDAWGNAVNTTGATPNAFLYRGEQYDPDLGIYYLRARYLNPLTGRFLSKDPADGAVTDPATLHKYLYGSADPVNRIDPTGWADDPPSPGLMLMDLASANGGMVGFAPGRITIVGYKPKPVDFCKSPFAAALLPKPITTWDLDNVLAKCLGLVVEGAGLRGGNWLVPKTKAPGASGSTVFTSFFSEFFRTRCGRFWGKLRPWAPTIEHFGSRTAQVGGFIGRALPFVEVAVDALLLACYTKGVMDLIDSRWQPLEECGCRLPPPGEVPPSPQPPRGKVPPSPQPR
jgi:RHS repeat-associated protein